MNISTPDDIPVGTPVRVPAPDPSQAHLADTVGKFERFTDDEARGHTYASFVIDGARYGGDARGLEFQLQGVWIAFTDLLKPHSE